MEMIQNVFREVFNLPELEIFTEMTAKDIAEWDSFNHLNLIMRLEDTFNITFTTDEITGIRNVGHLAEIIRSKGVSQV